jgi:hypothetical protein
MGTEALVRHGGLVGGPDVLGIPPFLERLEINGGARLLGETGPEAVLAGEDGHHPGGGGPAPVEEVAGQTGDVLAGAGPFRTTRSNSATRRRATDARATSRRARSL